MASLAEIAGWLFGWLLRNSAHAAVLAGVVWALERTLFKRLSPRWRYGLWLVVVVRLIIPIAPGSPLSLFNLIDFAPPSVSVALSQVLGLPSPVPVTLPESMHPLADTPPWFVGALALWLPGALILAALLARDHQRLQLAMDASPVWDEATLDLLTQSKAVMCVRGPVELAETSRISSPAISGWWRPRILLPVGLLRRLSSDETRFLFLHELAHVKRADIALNWVLAVVQILHWFNPVVWLALRRLLSVREEVCDDLVLRRCFTGAAREYGLTLIRILEECAPRRLLPAYAGVLDDVQALRQRVRSIRDFTADDSHPWSPAFATILLAVVGLTERTDHNALSSSTTAQMEVRRHVRPGHRGGPLRPVTPSPVPTPGDEVRLEESESPNAVGQLMTAVRRALQEHRFLGMAPATATATVGASETIALSSPSTAPAGSTRAQPQTPSHPKTNRRPGPAVPMATAAPQSLGPVAIRRAPTVATTATRPAALPPISRRGHILRPVPGAAGSDARSATDASASGSVYSVRQAKAQLVVQRRPAT